jgi:glycosyltransferase involved in cell wall biosynthesis
MDYSSKLPDNSPTIVVLIPCFNEERTIVKVITDFRHELPEAQIIVLDNNSTDDSAQLAKQAGAAVMRVHKQGKGAVVRHAFREIKADVYVMVDGDDTYPAKSAHDLIAPILNGTNDMVIGDRGVSDGDYVKKNKRTFHNFGNALVCRLVNFCFNSCIKDVMTGYRTLSRRFVKNVPILSDGFEVETEMTIRCLDRRLNITTVPISYQDRPAGSVSKLNTFKDGGSVLKTIFIILKDYKPLLFFGSLSVTSFVFSLLAGFPVIAEFVKTGYVLHVPLAILATGLAVMSVMFMSCALILDTLVSHERQQNELQIVKSS